MSAYCLFDNLAVHDVATLEEYKNRVAPIVEQYHGRYVVLGGTTEVVEGNWKPIYLVMIEFPTAEQARQWYFSEEYKQVKALRLSATDSTGVIIEGL